MSGLTPTQIAALRWMRDFPSNKAQWLVDGKVPRARQQPDAWNMMELIGPEGSIRIKIADWKALHELFDGCPSFDKIYGPNAAGLAVLAEVGK